MKKIIFTLVILFIADATIAQYIMSIKKTNGSIEEISTSLIEQIVFYPACTGTPTVDYGSKTYNTVQIGSQCWLKENLNVGTRISGNSDQTSDSPTQIIQKYCYNNDEANCTLYGGLYQWAEAVQYQNGASNTTLLSSPFSGNVQGICPTGWHIPTEAEFLTLSSAVSGDQNALKAIGEGTGTNTSGFSALLAGSQVGGNTFWYLEECAYLWSSMEDGATNGVYLYLWNVGSDIGTYGTTKAKGFSIRCLKG